MARSFWLLSMLAWSSFSKADRSRHEVVFHKWKALLATSIAFFVSTSLQSATLATSCKKHSEQFEKGRYNFCVNIVKDLGGGGCLEYAKSQICSEIFTLCCLQISPIQYKIIKRKGRLYSLLIMYNWCILDGDLLNSQLLV